MRKPKPTLQNYLLNQKEFETISQVNEYIEKIEELINPLFSKEIHLETELMDANDPDMHLTIIQLNSAMNEAVYKRMRELIAQNREIMKHLNRK